MSIDQRLSELGITLPQPAAPVAAYVPAVERDGLLQTVPSAGAVIVPTRASAA